MLRVGFEPKTTVCERRKHPARPVCSTQHEWMNEWMNEAYIHRNLSGETLFPVFTHWCPMAKNARQTNTKITLSQVKLNLLCGNYMSILRLGAGKSPTVNPPRETASHRKLLFSKHQKLNSDEMREEWVLREVSRRFGTLVTLLTSLNYLPSPWEEIVSAVQFTRARCLLVRSG
jgi:hypothetical protein